MHKNLSVSFFCPAYNDEENLPILIPKTVSLLLKTCTSFEIVIIDDASPDKTGRVADKLSKQYPNITVIHHKKNKGYGGALQSGFLHAKKYPYIFYTDGDNQYNVEVLKKMLLYINSYDAVIGYRKMRNLSWQRKIQTICYNKLIRLLFNLKNKDVNCAIRLFRRSTINKINFSSTSAFLPAEMLIELQRNGGRIKEIEVKHYPRAYGEASGGKLSVILPTFFDMIKYYFQKN